MISCSPSTRPGVAAFGLGCPIGWPLRVEHGVIVRVITPVIHLITIYQVVYSGYNTPFITIVAAHLLYRFNNHGKGYYGSPTRYHCLYSWVDMSEAPFGNPLFFQRGFNDGKVCCVVKSQNYKHNPHCQGPYHDYLCVKLKTGPTHEIHEHVQHP